MSHPEPPGLAGPDPRSSSVAAATSTAAPTITTKGSSTSSPPPNTDSPSDASAAVAAAAAAAAAANKTRRSHRKSRNGCAECKRRHIRCDERRPVCSNCVSADRTCVFPRGPAAPAATSPAPGGGVTKTSSPHGHARHATGASAPSPAHRHLSPNGVNGHQANGSNNTPSPSANTGAPLPRADFEFEEVCGPLPRPGPASNFRRSNYTYYPTTNPTTSIDTAAAAAYHSAPPTPQTGHSVSTGPGCATAASPCGGGLDSDAPNSASLFTPFHLQLFHHAQTVMIRDPAINTNNHFQQIVDIAIRHAVDAPYLLNEILAMTAVHMSIQKENQLIQQHQQQQLQQHQQGRTPTEPSSAILPPLLPPRGSPSSTSSPASSSMLPSISSSATTPSAAFTPASNPVVANLRHHATELQTRAVANFTRLTAHLEPDDTATCIPRFLFSSTLSMHALADSLAELRAAHADFHGFIDRFVDCFNLYRGIRAVIYPTWQFLSDSELRPLLQVTREANLGIVERGDECAPLHDLLRRSDLAPTPLEACRVAVDKLQWAFDLHNNLPPNTGQHAVSAFSVIVSAEYVDVLRKHRPEALIILSYFAVLLYRCRQFWIFQNSGAIMIRAIANHIGTYWRDAMAWPLQVIETEDC